VPPPYVVQVSSWESKIEERGFIPDAVCATYRNDSTIIRHKKAQTDFLLCATSVFSVSLW